MSNTAKSLEGKGPRPSDPYVRIVWAMMRGTGCTLSAKECHDMRFDDAIETVATHVVEGPPHRPE